VSSLEVVDAKPTERPFDEARSSTGGDPAGASSDAIEVNLRRLPTITFVKLFAGPVH
jgi:hypothetical protein